MVDLKMLQSIDWHEPEVVGEEGDTFNGWIRCSGTMDVLRKDGSTYTLGVSVMINPKNVTLSVLDLIQEDKVDPSAITMCFICDQPLMEGRTRKLWTGRGKYQYACFDCVVRDQDTSMIRIWKGETE